MSEDPKYDKKPQLAPRGHTLNTAVKYIGG